MIFQWKGNVFNTLFLYLSNPFLKIQIDTYFKVLLNFNIIAIYLAPSFLIGFWADYLT